MASPVVQPAETTVSAMKQRTLDEILAQQPEKKASILKHIGEFLDKVSAVISSRQIDPLRFARLAFHLRLLGTLVICVMS